MMSEWVYFAVIKEKKMFIVCNMYIITIFYYFMLSKLLLFLLGSKVFY